MKKQIEQKTEVNAPKDLMLALAIAGAVASAIGYFTTANFQETVEENLNDLKDLLNKIDARLAEIQKSVNRIEDNTILLIDLNRDIINRLTRIENTINGLPEAISVIFMLKDLDERHEAIEHDLILCYKVGVKKYLKTVGESGIITLEQNLDFIILNEYRPQRVLLTIKYCEFFYFIKHKDIVTDKISIKYISFIDRLKNIFNLELYLVRIDTSLNTLMDLLKFNSNGYWSNYIESHNLDEVIRTKNIRSLKVRFVVTNSDNEIDLNDLKNSIVSEHNYLLDMLETRAYIEKAINEQVYNYYNICNERLNSPIINKDNVNLHSFDDDELQKLKDSILRINDDLSSFKKNNNIPSGVIIAYAGSMDYTKEQELLEKGWLLCNGKELDSNDSRFTNLFKAIRYSWGGDKRGKFRIPKLDGQFLRGVTDDKSIDPDFNERINIDKQKNGAVGSYQMDQFFEHTHVVHGSDTNNNPGNKLVNTGAYGDRGPCITTISSGGTETRPKNAYVYWIIKM